MRWKIRGRDGKTGNVVNVSIEATTLAEAEKIALYNGMVLLEADHQQNAAPKAALEYEKPPAAAPPSSTRNNMPDYSYLSGTAVWLGRISIIVGIIACVMIVWPFVQTAILLLTHRIPFDPQTIVLAIISQCIPGVLVLLGAAIGRMLAAIGMAMRDVAENSFKNRGDGSGGTHL